MESFIITQLSIPELKKLFREEMEDFFSNNPSPNNADEDDGDEIGGIELAVRITGLKKQTIYGLASERKIPCSKRGKRLYFSRKDLLAWIKSGKRKTESEVRDMADKLDSGK